MSARTGTRSRRRRRAEIATNLTPLIDVTFLLIVFFVLVSRLVEVQNAELDLPSPRKPATMSPGREQQLVVNVIPAPQGRARELRVGERAFPADQTGLAGLTQHLAAEYAANPLLNVNLRADRGTHYAFVGPVLEAVAEAARLAGAAELRPRISLVVLNED